MMYDNGMNNTNLLQLLIGIIQIDYYYISFKSSRTVFENREDPTRKCYFYPTDDVPVTNDGHDGQLKIIYFSIYISTIF